MENHQLKFKLTRKRTIMNKQSPSYYTSHNGYHMATTVHANGKGDGAGTHVRESAPILKGKYDTQLKWPFIGKITVTLLNQLEDKNHHQDTLKQTATKKMHKLEVHGAGHSSSLTLHWAMMQSTTHRT